MAQELEEAREQLAKETGERKQAKAEAARATARAEAELTRARTALQQAQSENQQRSHELRVANDSAASMGLALKEAHAGNVRAMEIGLRHLRATRKDSGGEIVLCYPEDEHHLRGHEVTIYCRPHYSRLKKQYRGMRLVHRPSVNTKHLDTLRVIPP